MTPLHHFCNEYRFCGLFQAFLAYSRPSWLMTGLHGFWQVFKVNERFSWLMKDPHRPWQVFKAYDRPSRLMTGLQGS